VVCGNGEDACEENEYVLGMSEWTDLNLPFNCEIEHSLKTALRCFEILQDH
jgi:hypothetical protein